MRGSSILMIYFFIIKKRRRLTISFSLSLRLPLGPIRLLVGLRGRFQLGWRSRRLVVGCYRWVICRLRPPTTLASSLRAALWDGAFARGQGFSFRLCYCIVAKFFVEIFFSCAGERIEGFFLYLEKDSSNGK